MWVCLDTANSNLVGLWRQNRLALTWMYLPSPRQTKAVLNVLEFPLRVSDFSLRPKQKSIRALFQSKHMKFPSLTYGNGYVATIWKSSANWLNSRTRAANRKKLLDPDWESAQNGAFSCQASNSPAKSLACSTQSCKSIMCRPCPQLGNRRNLRKLR